MAALIDNDRLLLMERSSTAGSISSRPKFHSPPVELPSSNAQNFYEEAKIYPADENELKKKFNKFAQQIKDHPEPILTLEDFCCLLQFYEICPPHQYEAYFYAMDRNHDDFLDFQEFFLGCCAADPATVHILNSFTGYERAQYIFDFFDINRSATLEFNEFARLTAESLSLQSCNPNDENVRRQAIEKAKELGALEDAGHLLHFTCIKFKKFYEHIHTEKLRGTSRLFRFTKSIIKKRKDERAREDDKLESERLASELLQRKALDDTTAWYNFLLDEFETGQEEGLMKPAPSDAPHTTQLPAAPAPSAIPFRGTPQSNEMQQIAVIMLETFLVGEKFGPDYTDGPFTLLSPAQIITLCHMVIKITSAEPMVVTVDGPCKIFGSIHGQLWDLLSFFSAYGTPTMDLNNRGDLPYTNYIFLGDYVDRGRWSLEVVLLLFSLKCCFPHSITLLRGHHENRHLNYHLGFWDEIESRISNSADAVKIYDIINHTFEHLSIAAQVNQEIMCIHAGIQPSLTKVDQLKALKKPLVVPHPSASRDGSQQLDKMAEQLCVEIFTPHHLLPSNSTLEQRAEKLADSFLVKNGISLVIRSRMIPRRGASLVSSGKLFTITSCCDMVAGNEAAILHIIYEAPGLSIKARRLSTRSFSQKTCKLFHVQKHLTVTDPRWKNLRDVAPRYMDDPQALQLNMNAGEWLVSADDTGPCHAFNANTLLSVRRQRRKDYESLEKEFPVLSKESSLRSGTMKSGKSKRELDSSSGDTNLQAGSAGSSAGSTNKKSGIRNSRLTSAAEVNKIIGKTATNSSNSRYTSNKSGNAPKKQATQITFAQLDKEIQDCSNLARENPIERLHDPRALPYIWRLWQQVGWTEKYWDTALAIFETETASQLECRHSFPGWTLETFSMWILRSGRWLRDCQHWFKAFDFDNDGIISVADLLLGFLVTKTKCSGSLHGLRCVAIMRLFMTGDPNKQTLHPPELNENQFTALITEAAKTWTTVLSPAEVYPSMEFPMDHATFCAVANRIDLDGVFKLHVEGIGP